MDKENKILKQRIKYIIAFFVFFIVEVFIALFVQDKWIRPYLGDVLVVIVIYFGMRSILLDRYKLLPFYIFLFAVGVEVLQYFEFVQLLGMEKYTIIRILLGATFDIKDIICYAAGSILLFGYEKIIEKQKRVK